MGRTTSLPFLGRDCNRDLVAMYQGENDGSETGPTLTSGAAE